MQAGDRFPWFLERGQDVYQKMTGTRFMLFAHGALFLLRTPLLQALPWPVTAQVFDSVWLTVLSFEALLFTIAIAFIQLAMAKERTEFRHKTAAMVDHNRVPVAGRFPRDDHHADPVMRKTSQLLAVMVIHDPISEIICPLKKSR